MALFNINYGSAVMNKYMGMNVILPDEVKLLDDQGKYKVLYLYHGYTDDYSKWLRLTSIERYANETGIAVVMPDAGKSFYVDMVHGDSYFTYLTEEVPATVTSWFPITDDPTCTYIAGLSMGGYGAMKMVLTYPERYAGVGTFSRALAMHQLLQAEMDENAEDWLKRLEKDLPLVYGYDTDITGTENDVFALAASAKAQGKEFPKIYVGCGTEDFIYEESKAFKDHLQSQNIDCIYQERPGVHEWGFWDVEVQNFIDRVIL